MKKNALVLALSVTLGGLVSVSAFAKIDAGTTPGGNINFTGEVTSETCLIEGQTPNGSIDIPVTLQKVSASELSFNGATAKPQGFTIKLGDSTDLNCINGSVASVYFEPSSPNINATTGWLDNTDQSADGAKNVQIQILNESKEPINLRDNTNNTGTKTIDNQQAVFSYFGQYVAVGGGATPGKVASTVKYSIVYQ